MALLSKTIANLINGVSQQPPSIRNPTQCEAQENCLSDTTYGVIKRPPASFVGLLWPDVGSLLPFVHTINQNPSSRYKVIIKGGDLKVFGLDGVEKTVTFPDGKGYLASTNPTADFQCLTLGNKTYILNRTVEVAQVTVSSDYDASYDDDCLIFIKQGDYSTSYTVTVEITNAVGPVVTGPTSVTKTTSDTVISDIRTTQIATDLKVGLDAAFPLDLITTRSGSVLWLAAAFSFPVRINTISGISLEDSKGNSNAHLIRTQIQKFSDLPTVAPTYYPVQIVGDKASGFDDYFVRFFPDDPNSDFGNGSWAESWETGYHHAPDPSTMPLVLTDNGDGTFTCAEESWDAREAGNAVSNLNPSFIGHTIRGMFTFGNRLGFLSGDRVIMSEVGVYTNFYLTTVVTFLDSDPIDIQPLQGQGDWLYALPLAEKLILFSEKGQAVVNGDGSLLTPKTASLKTATRYPVSPNCEPVVLGSNIMFTADNGDYSKLYEYYVQRNVETLDAAEITSHVPKYIPSGVSRITADDSSRMLVAVAPEGSPQGDLYIYKYFWVGDQKVQSSWSRWSLPRLNDEGWTIADAHLLEGTLYLVVYQETSHEVSLLTVDLDITRVDSNGYLTHLDFRVHSDDCTPVTGPDVDGNNTYTLPFTIPEELRGSLKAFTADAADPRGLEYPCEISVDGTEVTVEAGHDVWFGFTYHSPFTFSEIHLKEDQNGSQVPTEEGKLSLRKLSILFNESLYFRVEVTPVGRDTRSYVMTPYVIGSPTPLEDIGPRSGRLSVPVNSINTGVTITVDNDSVVTHRLQSAEWVGQYVILSRRA